MEFVRNESLLPLSSDEIWRLRQVPCEQLVARELIVYDREVSDFFFEFQPSEDIELFLEHAHFACRQRGEQLISREDLRTILEEHAPAATPELRIRDGAEPQAPLKMVLVDGAIAELRGAADWRGMVTCCMCEIPGCGSQYCWIRNRRCLALFTVAGATLKGFHWQPFRFNFA